MGAEGHQTQQRLVPLRLRTPLLPQYARDMFNLLFV